MIQGVSCGPPNVIDGIVPDPPYMYEDVVTYTCTEDYKTYGNLNAGHITCLADKTWSKEAKCACETFGCFHRF